jgi:hypothetical protein
VDVKEQQERHWLAHKEAIAQRSLSQLDRHRCERAHEERCHEWKRVVVAALGLRAFLASARRHRTMSAIRRTTMLRTYMQEEEEGVQATVRTDENSLVVADASASPTKFPPRRRRARLPYVAHSVCAWMLLLRLVRVRAAAAAVVAGFLRKWRLNVPTHFYIRRYCEYVRRIQWGLAAWARRNRARLMWGQMQLTVGDRERLGAGMPLGVEPLRAIASQCAAKPPAEFGSRLVTVLMQRTPLLFILKMHAVRNHFRKLRHENSPMLTRFVRQQLEIRKLATVTSPEKATALISGRDGALFARPHLAMWLPPASVSQLVANARKRMEVELLRSFATMWDAQRGGASSGYGMNRADFAVQFEARVLQMVADSRREEFDFACLVAKSGVAPKGRVGSSPRRKTIVTPRNNNRRQSMFRPLTPSGRALSSDEDDNDDISTYGSVVPSVVPPLSSMPATKEEVEEAARRAEAEANAKIAANLRRSWFVAAAIVANTPSKAASIASTRLNSARHQPKKPQPPSSSRSASPRVTGSNDPSALRQVCRLYCLQRRPEIAVAVGVPPLRGPFDAYV